MTATQLTDTRPGGAAGGAAVTDRRTLIEAAIADAAHGLPADIRHIVGYHFAWWDADGQPCQGNGGKAIRPSLALLAAEAVGDARSALPAAVAVEFVHNFSLLHDDVMDGDTTRRHRPTAWRVFGGTAAILAGDALLTAASEVLAGSGHPAAPQGIRMLSRAVLDLVAGQSADVAFERREAVSLAECVRMARAKTGALLGCAAALGGLFGGGRPEQVERLRRFGANLGLAFQHVDDLLGIWGDPAATGKPVYSDLVRRKKSLPVVAALVSATPAAASLAELYRSSRRLGDPELTRAAELVEAAGGRAYSHQQADVLLDRALRQLAAAEPASRPAAELEALARLVTDRDR